MSTATTTTTEPITLPLAHARWVMNSNTRYCVHRTGTGSLDFNVHLYVQSLSVNIFAFNGQSTEITMPKIYNFQHHRKS